MFKYLNKIRVRVWVLVLFILLTPFNFIRAEIVSPYIVDEKPRVIFGDSISVTSGGTTYEGLENYTHNYVGGYLHLTFTYTHAGMDTVCCHTSYPPSLYVTDTDPQSTTTPVVRSLQNIYVLLPKPIPPGHETDWYLYDIQFDDTGYGVSVFQGGATSTALFHVDVPGLTDTDWAALASLYPNYGNDFSMAFTPLTIREAVTPPPPPVATTTPVIIVPGIMGSYLNRNDGSNEEIWMNILGMALPGNDSYLNDLEMLDDGTSKVSLTASDIIRKINIPFFVRDMSDGLIGELESSGYDEGVDLFVFPYDWRLDVSTIANELKEKIDEVKTQTGTSEVNLLVHSMGGLVAKEYVNLFPSNSVDKLIDLGTPHLGAPKSFLTLIYGETDISILNKETIKFISENMSSLYELLPSESYFDSSDPNYSYYVFDGASGDDRLSFESTQSYLKSAGRNASLVDRAAAFHQEIDGLNPADYGVETYNFVGCGTPTIGQFYVLDDSADHPVYNIKMIDGDGTVPLKSAGAIVATSTYYVKSAVHALMPSAAGVKELVASILTATSTDNLNISAYSNISKDQGGCGIPNGKIVSFHSPIDLHVYDQSGNHSGPDANGDIENNIPGVFYETVDGNKFAFLPEGVEYSIKGNATAVGSFDVRIQEVVDGEVSTTTIFANIPLTLSTQAQFAVGAATPGQIEIDGEDDGTFESSVPPSTITQGFLESDGKPVVVQVRQTSVDLGDISSSRSPVAAEEVTGAPLELETEELKQEERAPQIAPLAKPSEVIKPEASHTTSTEVSVEARYENTAVVYKSFGYKFTSFFKGLWAWFRSKL